MIEQKDGIGGWSIDLADDTPPSLTQRLRVRGGDLGLATLAVTDAWIPPASLGNNDTGTAYHPLLDLAWYSGVLHGVSDGDRRTLSGYGTGYWLGTPEGTGELWVGNQMTSSSNNARIFIMDADDWFDWMVNGGSRTAGDGSGAGVTLRSSSLYGIDIVTTPSGIEEDVPWFPEPMTRREVLDRICTYIGWKWYITPQMVVRAGRPEHLFPTVRTVVAPGIGATDDWVTFDGDLGQDETLDGYSNKRVSFDDNGGTYPPVTWAYPNSSGPTPDFYGPDGQGAHVVLRDDHLQSENILSWGARMIEEAPAGARARRQFSIDGVPNRAAAHLIPGEQIYAFDAFRDIYDITNPIPIGGEILYPIPLPLVGYSDPITDGMGVYLLAHDGAALEVIDLTPYVVYEAPAPRIEVGAPAWTVG